MVCVIPKLLEPTELDQILQDLDGMEFTDGKHSAGAYAKTVKSNLQLKETKADSRLSQLTVGALKRNAKFQAAALPNKISTPMVSRYEVGMGYGDHTDSALMNNQLRTDLSVTIFLCDQSNYDGGELIIQSSSGPCTIKLDAGDAVVYPSSSIHRVSPVVRGERLAIVTWVQSFVRDPRKREILSDLHPIIDCLKASEAHRHEVNLAYKIYGNLYRLWSEL